LSLIDSGELRTHVIAGLNFPPSQYQLHLQYLLPPLLPFHVGLFKQVGMMVKHSSLE
jgi:hypothetical protein